MKDSSRKARSTVKVKKSSRTAIDTLEDTNKAELKDKESSITPTDSTITVV